VFKGGAILPEILRHGREPGTYPQLSNDGLSLLQTECAGSSDVREDEGRILACDRLRRSGGDVARLAEIHRHQHVRWQVTCPFRHAEHRTGGAADHVQRRLVVYGAIETAVTAKTNDDQHRADPPRLLHNRSGWCASLTKTGQSMRSSMAAAIPARTASACSAWMAEPRVTIRNPESKIERRRDGSRACIDHGEHVDRSIVLPRQFLERRALRRSRCAVHRWRTARRGR